jgi:hypothetical protein
LDSETGEMQKVTKNDNSKKANNTELDEQFEEFKRKYSAVGEIHSHTDMILDKILRSNKISPKDRIMAEMFKLQSEMLCDLGKNNLVFEYKISYLEKSLDNLYTILRSALLKLDSNLVNLNTDVDNMKTALANPMYARIDQFITMMAEKEKQKNKKGAEYID